MDRTEAVGSLAGEDQRFRTVVGTAVGEYRVLAECVADIRREVAFAVVIAAEGEVGVVHANEARERGVVHLC